MIYITKKMYKAFGDFREIHPDLRGVQPVFNKINIVNQYPDYNNDIESLKLAGIIHKKVRKHLQKKIKPGIKLKEIAEIIETKTIQLSDQNKTINKGIGFPASLSLNNCAAHFHPLSNDNISFQKEDVLKIDFGTEVNGWIIDSAFTVCFNRKYDNLLLASKEATYHGIKTASIDARIDDWGEGIEEVMNSYEIKINGKNYQIKPIKNLGGHNIERGIIHGGTFLPSYKMETNERFKEAVYAIETFSSTNEEYINPIDNSTLYRINPKNQNENNNLLDNIKTHFHTLPFTDRYVENFSNNYKQELDNLINNKCIFSYPPLYTNNSYVAQYEHTIYIGENKKMVFSTGDDY
jgi:methionyl aminopeptidase